jgi:ubiquinone/menaquinone biosynthesis C-methylase UbiE
VEAERWAAWARTPGHDAYWYYRRAFFALIPPPGRATLEVGCGEGRVARDLAAHGHRVTAVDLTPALLTLAKRAHPSGTYLLADAAALPFRDGAFDLVVAYNSLMDVDDMPAAVLEMTRVLEPGGRLGICVTHPTWDAGKFASRAADAPFVIEGAYFGPRPFAGTFERDGLRISFSGWAYAIQDYFAALERAGLLVEALREPVPDNTSPSWQRNARVPVFLLMRVLKPR